MKRRIIALSLAVVMGAATLAGCSGDSKKSADNGGSANTPAPAVVDEQGKVNGLMYKEGLPLVDEGAYKFSIFVDDSSPTGEFYMLNEFQKQTNVEVDLRIFPNATAKERLNLDLNSGDYADVVGGWTLTDSMILTYGVQQKVFIPLEDLFEEYAPNISAILDLPGVREQMTAPDGHIYTIPYVTGDTSVNYSPYINSKWLQNVGMSMPTTTEEFEAVLKAFKEKDANGNGDPNDEIPFSTDPNNKHIEAMAGWFGMPMDKFGLAIVDEKVVYGGASDAYRNFLKWFSGLNKQGLIDVELFTQDKSTWEGKGNKNLYGASIAYGSKEFTGYAGKDKGDYDVLPVLNTDKGGIWLRDTNGFSVFKTQAVITDNAKNPEVIVRWFDNVFELENGIGVNRGPVGKITFKEGDQYRSIDIETLPKEEQEAFSWTNLWPQALPKYLPAGFEFLEDNPPYKEKDIMEETYEPYLTKAIITNPWIGLEDVDRYADISTALQDYFTQQQALFVTGEKDVNNDAQWEEYVKGLSSLGLEDWMKIRGIETIAK
ncbi:ABC transporter substrate-binding protein [Paenibacillus antibioticophila]|uniref:ABC transporter substrate-binding protein n=1 Tax=Paenibacillus antibioticophila TaxID=1274374 RepID=A0A920CHQ9_9BACL|nr:extracellular solute-binding protein [Paenibacillus antibioticophila]GIO38023.1 ABC transporter substrate-binding protein [Paenibacillus antibioticophila]